MEACGNLLNEIRFIGLHRYTREAIEREARSMGTSHLSHSGIIGPSITRQLALVSLYWIGYTYLVEARPGGDYATRRIQPYEPKA